MTELFLLVCFLLNGKNTIVLPFTVIVTSKTIKIISLHPICDKIFERFIFNKKFNFFSTNKLIFKNHSGFQTVDSCIKQLLSTVHEIVTSFDYELEVRSVLLDQSDAFGKVWQEELISKLKQNGISGELLHIISVF